MAVAVEANCSLATVERLFMKLTLGEDPGVLRSPSRRAYEAFVRRGLLPTAKAS